MQSSKKKDQNEDNFEMLHTKYKDRLTHPGSDTLYNNSYKRHLKDVNWSPIVASKSASPVTGTVQLIFPKSKSK